MTHFPEELADVEIARRRLALDEFVELQRQISRAGKLRVPRAGAAMRRRQPADQTVSRALGFELTGAQTKVLREIRADLGGAHPMRRLLQGDVGSGKTVVAACTALMALESGFNVALMAPTEILAEQHFRISAVGSNRWASRSNCKRAAEKHRTSNIQRPTAKPAHRASRIPHHASTFHRHPRAARHPASRCRSSAWSSLTSSTSSAWPSASNWCARAVIRTCL